MKNSYRFYIAIYRHYLADKYPNVRYYQIVGTYPDYVTACDRFSSRFKRDFQLLDFDSVEDFIEWKKSQKEFELHED